MGKWICKCGKILKDDYPEVTFFYYGLYDELDEANKDYIFRKGSSFDDAWDCINNDAAVKCPDCHRIWFDMDDGILTSDDDFKELIPTSNIISFNPEPTFLDNNLDIISEFEMIANRKNCEYELKYSNGKYKLIIGDVEISDDSLDGLHQILIYGKKY